MKFDKVIVWGYKNNTHTHHYIHFGWVKALKHMGFDTYWFENGDYPDSFDYSNSLFLTEGYVDQDIPLDETSTYVVHVCANPEKYVGRVKRLVDMRYLVDGIYDVNYRYTLDRSRANMISPTMYHEILHDNSGVARNHFNPQPMEYEAIYTCWATDLLPDDINFDDARHSRENAVYWFGSSNPGNTTEVRLFANECHRNGINFITNDPWMSPKSFEYVMQKTKDSLLAPDLRSSGDPNKIAIGETGTCHKTTGYIACRLFKSISYGQLGITNSRHMYEIMDRTVVYNSDEAQLFYDAMKEKDNVSLIQEQMKIVKEKHTFVNRVQDMLVALGYEVA